ncbi:hypothetical protein HD597_005365 [Nonomuraea thailandensis]|uniref:Uncharacterized protein n=1 Tax=Nonomuraea thailandensis TaxID=1188745 RepID=A0A9X2K3N4_9ACTN|nr:hypothetical protein [Nonomuraea thailandensis]MCP2358345.1 hypothetical protein [Nonomuraea thailandensis]
MRRRVFSALVTAPFALALLLTGCGSGDEGGADVASVSGGTGDKAVASAQPGADSQEKARKFAQCMRDNGVDAYPVPEGGMMRITREAAEDPDLKAAEEKCQQQAADASPGGS